MGKRTSMRTVQAFIIALGMIIGIINVGASKMDVHAADITTWAELQAALNNPGDSGTVTLTHDITAGENDTILTVTRDVTLDLNGHIIDRGLASGNVAKENGGVFWVYENGDLTIIDSNPDVSHDPEITYTDLETNESVEVLGGVITGGYTTFGGGAIQIYGNGDPATATLNAGTIVGNKALNGDYTGNAGGVSINYATFTMNGGAICGNSVSSDGTHSDTAVGGVHIFSLNDIVSTFNMNGGKICSNYTGTNANSVNLMGGVFIQKGNLNVSGGPKIIGNMNGEKKSNVITSNIYDTGYNSRLINITDTLDSYARIGVTTWRVPPYWYAPEDFTSGYVDNNAGTDPSTIFSLDDDTAIMVYDDDTEPMVALKFTITASDDGNGTAVVNPTECD